jgi:aconitate hydratase
VALGVGSDGKQVFLKDVWPTNKEVADLVATSVQRSQFLDRYGVVTKGTKEWQALKVETGSETYRWNSGSTYVKNPPYFDGLTEEPTAKGDITGDPG